MSELADLAAVWGKARPNPGQAIRFHPLLAHCLDVAAVGVLLPAHYQLAIDPRMLGFLVSLHDIGKISRSFQAQEPACWPASVLGPPPVKIYAGPRHDALGAFILAHTLADHFSALLPRRARGQPGWTFGNSSHIWRALAGHHGRPPEDLDSLPPQVFDAVCKTAAGAFIDAMRDVFRPPPWLQPTLDPDVVRLAWRLAGLTTLADWVGSRQTWFPYVLASDVADPARYYREHALPRAASALAAAGLMASTPAPFAGLRKLFPVIADLTPVQDWAETVPLPQGPVLAVIEDLTGSGKTEAALTLAHRLMAAGRAKGVYLALPTMATANAMFDRLARAYEQLFAADARPSLALAHGRADLNTRFMAAIEAETGRFRTAADPADEPAEAHCAAWLADDRRRALLAEVGVGTIDQALLAVLPVRHATLRLQGLAGKVLIVDEVHAYDHYMRQELATLLKFHAALGGSAILLSATLPRSLRRQLVSAFRAGMNAAAIEPVEQNYPLATIASADSLVETHCPHDTDPDRTRRQSPPRAGLPRTVTVERLGDAAAAINRIAAAVAQGAAVVWVRNTVDDAIEAAALLREAGIEPLLFHARFAMQDRLAIEAEVLRRWGRDGTNRPGVLVATQVVEQSLDLDFDLMVTDLAPADLLIQRAGRLQRHPREGRPVPGLILYVVSPEPVDDPPETWIRTVLPGTASVYKDHALLWRSARKVFSRGAIVTPSDMRPIIEVVFDRDAPDAVPPGLARSDQEAYGKGRSQVGLAVQNLLDLKRGYVADGSRWEPDTHTPTRLEDRPHVTLRLAVRRDDGSIAPYAGDADRRMAWAASEVSVARRWIAACPVPPELQAAADAARAEWGRWERDSPVVLLGLLIPDDDRYRLAVKTESGSATTARYHCQTGLSWPRPG